MHRKRLFMITALLCLGLVALGCTDTGSKNNNQDNEEAQQENTANNHSENENKSGSNADNAVADDDVYVTTTERDDGQVFHIISAYKWVEQYVQEAENVDGKNKRNELWQDIVMDRAKDKCLSGPYAHLVQDYVSSPPGAGLARVKNNLDSLNTSNIEQLATDALNQSADAFAGPDTTLCIFPGDNNQPAGVTLDAGKASIFYRPFDTEQIRKRTVAHEYHHSTWKEKYSDDYKWDIIGSIIFEGKAEYFASTIYGEPSSGVANDMDAEEEQQIWNKVEDHLEDLDGKLQNRILYGDGKEFPFNFGYTAGYHIVQAYIKNHPDQTVEEWSKLNPMQLYQASGYKKSFKSESEG